MTNKIQYWLMKTEEAVFSIDDLHRNGFTDWEGVRNFQARNFMRDEMRVGDLALFYHSNANPSGVAGICRVCRESHPDYTALDKKSPYFDPKATQEKPIWMMVEVEFVEKFPHFVSLHELRNHPQLRDLRILEKGSRLSITPVEKKHFEIIRTLGRTEVVEKQLNTVHQKSPKQR
jgi:predicted RNA-binding protein with PUA-like domain